MKMHELPGALRKTLYVLGIIVLVLLFAYAGLSIELYSDIGAFPHRGAEYPAPAIGPVIWPTMGYPSLVKPGARQEVEIDPGALIDGRLEPRQVKDLTLKLRPVREELNGLSIEMTAVGLSKKTSAHWPAGTKYGGKEVFSAVFHVPEDAPPELYDISIEGTALCPQGNRKIEDGEPHAVAVVENDDNDFRFITLADIHVHRRDASGTFIKQTDKGLLPDGTPVFLRRAIEQVNLIRPDFVFLLGDFVRAQHEPGDYRAEFEEFYRTMDELEVPAFALPGNHDLYVNGVDGRKVWEENLGPLYYSFDVGDCHFSAANSYEWPFEDRVVMDKMGLIVFPHKWQGQMLDAEREDDPSTYRGQLAWLRDDLDSHGRADMKSVLLHHDPYNRLGRGDAFNDQTFAMVFSLGGGGRGKEALRTLASEYQVDYFFSGHMHTDIVGSSPWDGGGGMTVYATQTCVYYDEGGFQDKYPGYRLVVVDDARVESFTYLDGFHSYPFYDGSRLDGETDLENLDRPALSVESTGRGDDGSLCGWEVCNYLACPMELRGLFAVVDRNQAGYRARGGEVYRTAVVNPRKVALYVSTGVEEGEPGESATSPGSPARRTVEIVPASTPSGT